MAFTQQQLDQIRDQVVAATGKPKSITVDGETFTAHALSELLQAYKLAQAATLRQNSGVIFRQFVPPSAGGRRQDDC